MNMIIERKNFSIQGNPYFYHYLGRIIWLPGDQGYWIAQNTGKVNSYGVEFYGKMTFSISSKFIYGIKSSININKSVVLSTGKILIYQPHLKWTINQSFTGKNFRLYYKIRGVSSQFISTDNLTYMPGYIIHNAMVETNLFSFKKQKIKAYFEIDNLTNVKYQVMPYRPMPGINFKGGVYYSFK
jgi:iron complex outermembrane receptor protein